MMANLYDHLNGATDEMGRIIAKNMPNDWLYRDIPWVGVDIWNEVMQTICNHGTYLLAATQRGNEVRGQLFISPKAAELLTEYSRRFKQ